MKQIRILSFLSASAFYPFVGIRILSFFRIRILSFLSVRQSARSSVSAFYFNPCRVWLCI
jgi:hypothetical protein